MSYSHRLGVKKTTGKVQKRVLRGQGAKKINCIQALTAQCYFISYQIPKALILTATLLCIDVLSYIHFSFQDHVHFASIKLLY